MSITKSFSWLYSPIIDEICGTGGRVLLGGHQVVESDAILECRHKTLNELFSSRRIEAVSIDFHDSRASVVHDLNNPLPESFRGKFDYVWDIGTIEHIADSVAVFRNYISSLVLGGRLFMTTPCKGYFDHGFHTFSPEFITGMLIVNGFTINSVRYIGTQGNLVDIKTTEWVNIHVEATKTYSVEFSLPQQGKWIQ